MRKSIDCDSRSWKLWTINACKLDSKSSFIKPEFSEPLTRNLRNRLSRKANSSMVMTYKTKQKFQPNLEGPFVVESVYSNGAYRLINLEGDILMMSINSKFLKKYCP